MFKPYCSEMPISFKMETSRSTRVSTGSMSTPSLVVASANTYLKSKERAAVNQRQGEQMTRKMASSLMWLIKNVRVCARLAVKQLPEYEVGRERGLQRSCLGQLTTIS